MQRKTRSTRPKNREMVNKISRERERERERERGRGAEREKRDKESVKKERYIERNEEKPR